jgi:hypothetical protein
VQLWHWHWFWLLHSSFVVFFREMAECIRILAVAHGARKPGYWARHQ